jgi:Tol biopolymer transport system component
MLVFEMMTNCSAGVPDGIYVINRDGSGLREVVAVNAGNGMVYPVWSPQPASDGYYKIAFSDQVAACGANNLFVVNLDGTGLTNLTNTCSGNLYSQYYPSWDPAGTRLAVQVYPCAVNISCSAHLYVYDLGLVNGLVSITGATDLTASGGTMGGLWVYRSDWARTQDKIVFKARFLSNINNSALWIVSLIDPANPVELTATYNNGTDPGWSPDDSRIVFSRTVQRKATISVITADGSTVTDLATMGGSPAWRRCCPTCIILCSP